MQMASFVEALQSDLEQIAAVGDDATSAAAQRLAGALKASAGLRLLDALAEAALELNVRYGAWYLRHLLDKYGDERTALAAYNAGQDNVDRWRREGRGIAFAETRAYVDRVEKLKAIYRDAYGSRLGPAPT